VKGEKEFDRLLNACFSKPEYEHWGLVTCSCGKNRGHTEGRKKLKKKIERRSATS
jgi:hypothetical protein